MWECTMCGPGVCRCVHRAERGEVLGESALAAAEDEGHLEGGDEGEAGGLHHEE